MSQIAEIPRYRIVGSNLCGSISVACWVFLLLPQLIEQWRLKSADGIAIGFITLWLIGDIANLLGAVIGHLRPNVILLALWFCFSDSLLILSYIYYKNQSKLYKLLEEQPETRPLLASEQSTVPAPESTEPAHHHNNHHHHHHHAPWWLSTGVPLLFVILVAAGSYLLSDSASPGQTDDQDKPLIAELLGYFSAAMYLCARIPQIIQNHRRRSVEGLSVGFFLLSMLGNLTYAGQILILRQDREWVMLYLPWLLGSVGTIFEDLIIFVQFYIYDDDSDSDEEE